jgi:hypothetical protein
MSPLQNYLGTVQAFAARGKHHSPPTSAHTYDDGEGGCASPGHTAVGSLPQLWIVRALDTCNIQARRLEALEPTDNTACLKLPLSIIWERLLILSIKGDEKKLYWGWTRHRLGYCPFYIVRLPVSTGHELDPHRPAYYSFRGTSVVRRGPCRHQVARNPCPLSYYALCWASCV